MSESLIVIELELARLLIITWARTTHTRARAGGINWVLTGYAPTPNAKYLLRDSAPLLSTYLKIVPKLGRW